MMPREIALENIPARLRELPRWVCWKVVERDGKPTKCPVSAATGANADSTDPATWATFDAALAAFQADEDLAGIGFVFAPDDGLCGVDLDDSIDPATGELKPWAREIVEQLNSYTEVSPSGHGVKIFLRAQKPGGRCRKGYHDGEAEMYSAGRFFTVTGRRLDTVSADVEGRQAELEAVYRQVFGDIEPLRPPVPRDVHTDGPDLTDDEIVNLASTNRKSGVKFSALWNGHWNDYFNSASEADSSVVFTLAFYTKDAGQIDRLFRRSRLYRDKWDEVHGAETYGQTTIAKALAKVTAQYRPRKRKARKPRGAAHPTPVATGGLPAIVIDDVQLRDLTAQGLSALRQANAPPVLFVRSGSLCRVTRHEDGLPAVDDMDKVRLRARLADTATFYRLNRQRENVNTNPPLYLAENILAQGTWDFPALVGVARSPILRRDGTICTTPGYDAESRLYYCPDPDLVVPPIPEVPSDEEVAAARDALIDLVGEFPFADGASLANAMAILLSILMRPVITGHVPLAIVDAPVQGTGKTLMVTALGTVGVGMVAGESIPDRQNDDEWRKKITAVLLKGPPLVLLDNIPDNSTIDAPPLAALLTTNFWSDRLLGKNDNVQLPSRAVWVATGNNLRVAGDMPRRCYTVRMDANSERPWTRTGFRHADLEQYAAANRGKLLAAAFTLIRSWFAAGKPRADVPAFGSFQEWADTVGGVLAHVGFDGFLANLEDIRSVQDEDTLQWQAFFAAWWDHFGDRPVTADDLAQRILSHENLSEEPLPEPLLVNKDRGEGSLKRSIGRNLSRLTGRIFDGRKLCDAGANTKTHVRIWCLRASEGPVARLVTSPEERNLARNLAQEDESGQGLTDAGEVSEVIPLMLARAQARVRTRAPEISGGRKITSRNLVTSPRPAGEEVVI